MAPPSAPLGRPASAAVPGLMVVRRTFPTVVSGMARPSAPALGELYAREALDPRRNPRQYRPIPPH
eukprot:scaffold18871_cov143-Isochrysis_galbana.AAC.1